MGESQAPASAAAVPVIAIDGPSGVGKGTLAARLAEHLGWHLLDSGAIYRVLGYAALQQGVAMDDGVQLARLARALDLCFERGPDGTAVPLLDGVSVAAQIRTEDAGAAASRVAAHPAVREALLALQHGFRRAPGLIADGRDMGTVVFPDSTLKLFLTASARVRAERRHKQLMEKGVSANIHALFEEIAARDQRDRERATAPLVAAADAVEIDSTGKSVDAVWQEVLSLLPSALTSN